MVLEKQMNSKNCFNCLLVQLPNNAQPCPFIFRHMFGYPHEPISTPLGGIEVQFREHLHHEGLAPGAAGNTARFLLGVEARPWVDVTKPSIFPHHSRTEKVKGIAKTVHHLTGIIVSEC